jgi:hypothetical protein
MAERLNVDNLKQILEQFIRAGKMPDARQRLASLDTTALPREEYGTFANFARRAGAAPWALKLLKPVIYSEDIAGISSPPSAEEVASYALALCTTGALSEAKKLLSQIENADTPVTLQACAYVSIWNWDYSRAIHFLKKYLRLPGLSDFQVALAQLNLASSHEYVGHVVQARKLVEQLLPRARQAGWSLIERDTLLLSVQLNIAEKQWSRATSAVSEALDISHRVGLDSLLVHKWRTVIDLYNHSSMGAQVAAVEKLSAKARQAGRWEIRRDLDYYLALIRQDTGRMDRLYFGTPFPSYRKRLLSDGQEFWSPPTSYLWNPLQSETSTTMDLASGKISSDRGETEVKDLCLKLIQVLASDFYRPFKRGGLFAQLYPEKRFDVTNSSHTIANVILRLREMARVHALPIEVRYANHHYELLATGPMQFLICDGVFNPTSDANSALVQLRRLQQRWPYQTFSIQQAGEILSLTKTGLRNLLQEAVGDGHLIPVGKTRSKVFRFASRKKLGRLREAS